MPYAWVEDNGTVRTQFDTVAEAKIAIKELRLEKKDWNVTKKDVAAQIAAIRADYRSEVAQRGSKVQGGGGFGRFLRGMQTASRDNRRAKVDEAIRPLEEHKADLDRVLTNIDSVILQLERYVLENK